MKKRKLKKEPFILLGIILFCFLALLLIFALFKHYTSYEYKLGKIGYDDAEIAYIVKLDKKYIDYALKKYDRFLIPLTKQKYLIWSKYDDYLAYIKKTYKSNSINYKDVIAKVNTKTNYDFYTHTLETDMDKGYGILVNKYYYLPDKYEPKDIVSMSNSYAYPNNSIKEKVYEAFKEMSKKAKEDGITLIVNSSYRDYNSQKRIYEQYEDKKGQKYADSVAARPNFSEHQTGLALDIFTPGAGMKNFEGTDAFKWLSKNAYKYGFILRYPKDKESITGYDYEAWHYRYLGKDLATKVFNSGLTFDEYYAYYLDK
ncbi:MAG: M15 family metallopeptidase [Bacilli bacterium]|nr:M15 family metallopeptidase [Bacilli bacterium]